MKIILAGAVILAFVTLQANGQLAQEDTLYLKDGSKVAGKLVGIQGNEYRLKSADGKVFVFTADFIEKIVSADTPATAAPRKTLISKTNPDTMTVDELNLHRHAVNMRNAGMILTITGPISIIVGLFNIAGFINYNRSAGSIFLVSFIYGIPSAIAGPALWAVGASSMKLLASDLEELNLQLNKAVRLKNAGMILTLGGLGLVATTMIIDPGIPVFPVVTGLVSTFVGIPLWASGSGIKTRAELIIQKFKIVPENSMALGLGMTITF